jgi:hypothetical protein
VSTHILQGMYKAPFRAEVVFSRDGAGTNIRDASGSVALRVDEWAVQDDDGVWQPGPFARYVVDLLNANPPQ